MPRPVLLVPSVLMRGVSSSRPAACFPITRISVFAKTHLSFSSYHKRAITFWKMLTFGFQSKSPRSHAKGARVQRHICEQSCRLPRFTLSPLGRGMGRRPEGGRRPEAGGRPEPGLAGLGAQTNVPERNEQLGVIRAGRGGRGRGGEEQ